MVIVLGKRDVEELKFQLPGGALVVKEEPPEAKFWSLVPEPTFWGEEAETIKAAAVVLAAIDGMEGEECDCMRKGLIKLMFSAYRGAVIGVEMVN